MFSGIINHTSRIANSQKVKDGLELTFPRPKDWTDIHLGDSISTNGVCLTIARLNKNDYTVLLMPETLSKTSFGTIIPDEVNLERSLKMADRMDGHFVPGHVDGIGRVKSIDKARGYIVSIEVPLKDKDLVVYKGSIAINGVSLTISKIAGNVLSVSLIPHTLKHTTFSSLKVGDFVNLEYDILGKYIQRVLKNREL